MKAAIYIRVSTDMQAEDGFSIEGQRTRLESFIQSQDWSVHDYYIDEGKSAKDLNRPEMQRMLQDMEDKQFDVIVVYKLDRLTRSVADLHGLLKRFDQYGVKFKSSTEVFETTTAMGRFFITLVGAMAEWERETISERVRFGVEQMIIEGRRPGGVIPYGYTQNEELIPEEASLIRYARDLYMGGMGYKAIAMKLNREGKLRRGQEWTSATAAYTLENPYYAGILRLGSKTSDGNYANGNRDKRVKCLYGDGSHEPIFTKVEYEQTKELMERRTQGGYSRVLTYWFSGVLRCGRCGAAMFGRMSTARSTTRGTIRTPYYICSNKHSNKSCDMPTFRQVHVEHLVMEYISKIKWDMKTAGEIAAGMEQAVADKQDEAAEARREINRIAERREKWQYMFVEGLIGKDAIRKKIAEEDAAEEAARKKLASVKNSLSVMPDTAVLEDLQTLWKHMDDEEKKTMVYEVFEKIVLNTPETNVKGVKNKFFKADIEDIKFN
ncbi:recombinase family protein [Paenibacillus sp. FSL R5-0713]|uniref:recombinase family protein n=1 Tax=Paenibacillus sp. FSL R5-0713 TaxID=2921655 RepID=UPI0030D86792